jgi:hypothetical protein
VRWSPPTDRPARVTARLAATTGVITHRKETIVRQPSTRSSLGIFWIIAALVSSLLLTTAVVVAAGNPSATLDQCANGSLTNPDTTPCLTTGSEWVNGNLGSSKAHYSEGDSVPYRFTFANLGLASHTVTLEWDTTKSGKHALDYITTWNRTVTDSNPCVGVSGCTLGSGNPFPIPVDPQVTGGGVTQVAGNFTIFGGTITNVSAYSYANGPGFAGDKSARLTVTFTPSVANPVLAWGGHIATRPDWGIGNSAVAISGSPYHMRLIDLDGSGGNQDRSLSADAVTFPGSITIIKDADPNDAQDFAFTTTGGLPDTTFSLDDDSDSTLSNTKVFSNITTFGSYTVEETTVSGWTVSFANPPCTLTSSNGGSSSSSGSKVTITMKEGENYSCTFTNTRQNGTITLTKVVQNTHGGNAGVNDFSLTIGGTGVSSGGSISAAPGTPYTINETQIAGYEFVSITGTGCPAALGGTVTVSAGGSASCTITNRDIAPTLALTKIVDNSNGGSAVKADFTLTATPTTGSAISGTADVSATAAVSNVEYTLSESGPAGYVASGDWSCTGTGVVWSSATPTKVTLNEGATGTCTIQNNDVAPTLALNKTVSNLHGGNAVETDFVLSATPTSGTTITNAGGDVSATAGKSGVVYTLSETGVTGYTGGTWSCTGAGTGWSSADATHVTLSPGGAVTCSITNTDVAPTLALNKTVSNLNGGSAVEDDFVLTATPTTGSAITDAGGDVPATAGLSNTEYTLSESSLAGYTGGTWSCSGTGVHWNVATPTKVTLDEGATGNCSITNSDSKNDPTGGTTMAWVVKDSASYTIRAGAGDAGSATIDFKLYSDLNCAVQVGTTHTVGVTISGGGVTAAASDTTGYAVGVGTYRWRTFYSGDGFNNAASTACGSEITTISTP